MANNTVIFGGDIAPSDASRELFREKKTQTLFTDIIPVLKEADNVIVNLETALTDKDLTIRKHGPNIKGPVEMAQVLKEAGVTACGLANNHIFDFGVTGLRDTFSAIDAAGMDRFGAGENEEEACRPYFFTAGDKKIAVIAVVEHEYTYAQGDRPGAAPFDPFDTMVRIRDAKKESDYVVVMYHGGKEQCEYPSPRIHKGRTPSRISARISSFASTATSSAHTSTIRAVSSSMARATSISCITGTRKAGRPVFS
ncbi:MAG: CapA family protein [Clostridia bacterium]|nr:CapA family protein [Clostridia bacterium]